MTEFVATTLGLLPLPDWAKRDLEDLKGHQKHDLVDGNESEADRAVYAEAREELLEAQADADIDVLVEGQLRWDDMLVHPLAVHDAVETHGIVRYYDNNNFYREPVVTGELTFDGDMAADLETATEHTDDLGAVIPGPYTLADLATDEYYGDEDAFLEALAAFLADEIKAFPDVETVLIAAPSLATAPPAAPERVADAIDTVVDATDAETILYPYWDALDAETYAAVADSDVDTLGFDLVSAWDQHVENVQSGPAPERVALGIVDGQNTRTESPAEIREMATDFFEETGIDPAVAYLMPNTGTFYLPTNRFVDKLDALGATSARPEATQ